MLLALGTRFVVADVYVAPLVGLTGRQKGGVSAYPLRSWRSGNRSVRAFCS